jgi:hypothetical protein
VLIPLNLLRDQPLQQQLYDQLHGLIASARLQPGARMPSTRVPIACPRERRRSSMSRRSISARSASS